MAASSEKFPWPSHYKHYNFFEDKMRHHSKVTNLKKLGDRLYHIHRTHGDVLKVFICECYAFGPAELIETKNNHNKINAIIINSAWCGYTDGAKKYGRTQDLGIFNIGEFMSALNCTNPAEYLTEDQKEVFM